MPSQEALERGRVTLVTGDDAVEAAHAPSLLRASLLVRLVLVVMAAGVLWLAVYWALT